MAGFIVGFDNDPEDVFDRQVEFIRESAIPIAMVGLLQALPGTQLYRWLEREGRLVGDTNGNNIDCNLSFIPTMSMIELVRKLKARYGLKIAVVSNEGRELNAYRIRKFKLDGFVDSSISSCFVHVRKPDADIFRLALDIAQAPARQVVFIENTPMFVQIAGV
jgi:phosphoglycolate phosphatase-like HAD superfamily hydrolase